ncbi:pentapeptide repeat protein [Halanaerobium saccharolyticum]|uniref:Pentapeptide repeat protein n=1 Tax=Halanaerobium saccharolyticum TaxID=43595 RepID=A0A2T5RIX0_9FIRM|nr:potassium channel family protein [Halanaerobium saccharolyticum]PTV98366.1 pentapeptide repeat protein [Halanaerobium saccharolyticum]
MEKNKCKHNYKDDFGKYHECNNKAWKNSKKNYCILHAKNNKKPKELFNDKLNEKIKNNKNKELDLTEVYFCDLSIFKNREIKKRIIFNNSYFTNECVFEGTLFKEKVNFSYVKSPKGSITFKNVVFKKDCEFSSIDFYQIYLSNVKFFGRANFKNSKIKMLDITDCGKTIFMSLADFSNTKFVLKANFSDSIFEKEVRFYNTKFHNNVNFDRSIFKNSVKFSGSEFKEVTCKKTFFEDKKVQEFLCRKARLFCEETGDREEADKYFKLERRAKRNQYNSYLHKFLEFCLADFTTEYGTSWLRILFLWISTILGSSFIYFFSGGLKDSTFLESLYFSMVTFVTLGYGDLVPTKSWIKLFASFEALIGAFLIAAFISVFSRKFMR